MSNQSMRSPGELLGRGFAIGLAAVLLSAGPADLLAAAPPRCTVLQGQRYIDQSRYKDAIREFTCVVDAQPTEVDGYRGRIEAELLLGRFSDAVRDYVRVNAFVVPVHPDAASTILAGYAARLALDPGDRTALTGESFAQWWFFQYNAAIHTLNDLLALYPDDVYGNLLRGSSRMLQGVTTTRGAADLERAIVLAPQSPDVRFIVADAYTYGQPDPERAFAEASLALGWGLDTPRIHAILGSAYLAFGDMASAAAEIKRHIDLVTTELVKATALGAGSSLSFDLVPGRTFEVPVSAAAGQTLTITTDSPTHEIWDSIVVLLAPDGTPVAGGDDYIKYFAGFQWVAPQTAIYRLQVTSFESASTGVLRVTRD